MMITKLDKKSLIYLGIVLIMAIFVSIGSFYFLSQIPEIEVKPVEKKPAEKTMKEILESLGTPGKEGRKVSEEVLESLGIPGKEGRKVSEEVLESLGTPE